MSCLHINFEKHLLHHFSFPPNSHRDLSLICHRTFHFPGGRSLLHSFRSLSDFFRHTYPFLPSNHTRNIMEIISRDHPRYSKKSDWIENLDQETLMETPRGAALLQRDFSILRLLQRSCPEIRWEDEWAFMRWGSAEGARVFVDGLLLRGMDVRGREDLEAVGARELRGARGGWTVLNKERPVAALREAYPELPPPTRPKAQANFLGSEGSRGVMERIRRYYALQDREAWERVSVGQIGAVYEKSMEKKALVRMLGFWHPEEAWDQAKLSNRINKRCHQRHLGRTLQGLLPGEVIFEDFALPAPGAAGCVEVDFFVPGRRLAVEYQGEQHYANVAKWFHLEDQQRRDAEKQQLCVRLGVELVSVPFWWDGTVTSLRVLLPQI